MKMGKSLVAATDLPSGHRLTYADIAMKSPGDGIPPFEVDRVVGSVLRQPLAADTLISIEHLDN